MKVLIYSLIVVGLYACSSSNEENELPTDKLPVSLVKNPHSLEQKDTNAIAQMGKLSFTDTIHSFGRIKDGEQVTFEFEYKNVGSNPVVISEAKASCGCTVPEYTLSPIQPGEKSTIKVTFDSKGKRGMNEKNILVRTNANPSIYNLYIQAEVY